MLDGDASPARASSLVGLVCENWDAFYFPVGDAGKTLETVVSILQGKETNGAEKWGEDLLA